MLIDEVEIVIRGGHGGPGKVSFFKQGRGPDGGSGGKGGNVFLETTSDLMALGNFAHKRLISAPDGGAGESNAKHGRDADDITLKVPQGTKLVNIETGEELELNENNTTTLFCRGGLGGRGNHELRSSRNTTPMFAQSGLPGEEKNVRMILRLIADFGLIGLPNAGKSSLLNALTNANAKIGDYPFTTLEPNLGAFGGKIIADIPGLIEGASAGKGLGDKFLKHIEKVNLLIHCLSAESPDLSKDYQTIRTELGAYNPDLLLKPEMVIVTKVDLISSAELKKKLSTVKKMNKKVVAVSILDEASIEKLKALILNG